MNNDSQNIIDINPKTLKETIRCKNEFACLENENYVCRVAKVENCIAGTLLFIDCKDRSCNYKTFFGDSIICNCPTRKELYNRYKI